MNHYWLFISVLFCMVNADYWTAKLQTDYGVTCSGPRIRNSYSAMTFAERERMIKMVFQLKLEIDAWKKGQSTQSPLYNTFVEMHLNSRNAVWHYTSVFPYAHKAFLWLYESTLIYTGVKYGLLTTAQACSWGIPYWPWETSYDYNPNDSVVPVFSASVFSDPTLNGDATPATGSSYVDTGYFARPEWVLQSSICSKSGGYCDKKLKRYMVDVKNLNLDPAQIVQKISTTPKYVDFLPWIHGNAHNNIHIFLSYSMQTQGSPDEPMFFMHHGNIDRLVHYWADCHDYDKVDPNSLTTTHYFPINPTDATSSTPHTAKDASGTPYSVTLDSQVPLFVSSEGEFKYCLRTEFPTVRQMWSMGTSTQKGWNGLYYRYGPDALTTLSSTCKTGSSWSWVNYGGSKKRSESEFTEEMGTPEEMLVYQNLTRKYDDLVQKQGKTPEEALYDLAMDSCQSNPQQELSEKELKYLVMMGVDFHASKRICDAEITVEDIEMEMENNMAMSFK